MFEQTPPTQLEKANHIRTEFNPAHPRIRMSLIMYLVENGVTPADYDTDEKFVAMLDALIEWIGEDMDDFIEMVEGLDNGEDEEEIVLFDTLGNDSGEDEGYR